MVMGQSGESEKDFQRPVVVKYYNQNLEHLAEMPNGGVERKKNQLYLHPGLHLILSTVLMSFGEFWYWSV